MLTLIITYLAAGAFAAKSLPDHFTAEILSAKDFKKMARPRNAASEIIMTWYYSMNDEQYDTKFSFEKTGPGSYSMGFIFSLFVKGTEKGPRERGYRLLSRGIFRKAHNLNSTKKRKF